MSIPHIIKYMGSKRNILEFVTSAIQNVREGENERLFDIFGGTAIVSASFRNIMPVTCNDIQSYTSTLAKTYLKNYQWELFPDNVFQIILDEVNRIIVTRREQNNILINYNLNLTYDDFLELENLQKRIIDNNFNYIYHLFTKYYSGTYWSYNQCLEIDAICEVLNYDEYRETFIKDIGLSSLMFAMAYTTIGTGHYAQFREPEPQNMSDFLIYRKKSLLPLFEKKLNSLSTYFNDIPRTNFDHQFTTFDYNTILKSIDENSIVYADPPYQFVHYSRFYHALETLVKYDFPEVEHKGRYRNDRHQSPFCQRKNVGKAFSHLFNSIDNKRAKLILSYSNNGLISLDEILLIAQNELRDYNIRTERLEHTHSTMGRSGDKSRQVEEILLICTPN